MIKLVLGIYIIVFFLHPMEVKSKKVHERHTKETIAKRQHVNNPYMQYKMFLKPRILPLSGLLPKQPLTKTTHKHVGSKGIPLYHDSNKYCDDAAKKGSFKIDDGVVQGFGTYQIEGEQVNIDLSIKISNQECKPQTTPAPGGETTPAPGVEAETTAAPVEAETTPAPGGGGETTAAPAAGGETTAAPAAGGETTAAPGSTTPSSSSGSDVEQQALDLHNKFRAVHDAPAMTLNAEMSKSAADYAATIANLGSLQHSDSSERDNAGENLSYGCSSSAGQTPEEAVTNWYNEVCDPGYTFGSESMGGAGHFTQVVWKDSVQLGFGKADSEKDGMICSYYVGRYKNAGNMIGDFATNVTKGSFDTSYCNTIKKKSL